MTKLKILRKAGELIIFLVLLLAAMPVFAEIAVDTAWVRRYDGPGNGTDCAWAIVVDDSYNVYVTGVSLGSGTYHDYATIKYYPNGDTAWVRRYNGPGDSADYAYAIAVDGYGNAYVTGFSDGSGVALDYATIKYYPNGDTAWIRRYNGPGNSYDYAYAIVLDQSGYIYVTGQSRGSGTSADYATIKYYPNGDTAWVRRYNGPGNLGDGAVAITVDESGGVYVTGSSSDSVTSDDYTTIKYSPDGDTAWVRRYNGPGNSADWVDAIAVDVSGNVYVTGGSRGSGTSWDYAIIKYYPNGDTAWVRRYDGPGNSYDRAYAMAVDVSGNVYVTGESYIISTDDDYATIKYYPNGDTAWVRRYNGPGNSSDGARGIAVDDSGNVYVTGRSRGNGTSLDYDYAIIKYYPNGDTAWLRRYNGPPENGNDEAYAIALDVSRNVYVAGMSEGSGTDYDYATIKYFQSIFEPSPHVVFTSPAQNQLNVPVNTDISVTFDIDMDQATINDSTLVVNAWSTGHHPGAITYDSPTKTATLNPYTNFDEGEIVTVVLTNGIKSSDAVSMESSYVWSFTAKADEGAACFALASSEGSTGGSHSVFCADLDGDGDMDLVVAKTDSVSIFKNNGDGTFQGAVNYGAGSFPFAVYCADLDGDGDLDLAVANRLSDRVSILINNGTGGFGTKADYPTGSVPTYVSCGDLDGDGDLDMAVTNSYGNSISILKNDGDGTFLGKVDYSTGAWPMSVFCSDLDGDGSLDLAVASSNSNSVSILKNNGDGTFQAKIDYDASQALSVFCADLDSDGDLDLAVAGGQNNCVSVLKNNGDGTFQAKVDYDVGLYPTSVFCADVDGDGDLDLAAANVNAHNISILKNNGDGTFQSKSDFNAGSYPASAFCADLDMDGDMDIAIANNAAYDVTILLNIQRGNCTGDEVVDVGDVVFLINYLFKNGTAPEPLAVGDVNCDGVDDVGDVVHLINYLFKSGPAPCC